jgi:hypothetical protein
MGKADGDSNSFTIYGFKTVLTTLKTKLKLTALDMQLPHVKELDISRMSTQLLFSLEVGDKGAQFVAQNLINLNSLWIGRQWSDLGINSIGD